MLLLSAGVYAYMVLLAYWQKACVSEKNYIEQEANQNLDLKFNNQIRSRFDMIRCQNHLRLPI